MTLSSFMELSGEEKRSVISSQGVPLATWENRQYLVFLFQLPHFYVETYCSKQTRHIDEFRLIHNPEHLSPYLEHISLDELFKK